MKTNTSKIRKSNEVVRTISESFQEVMNQRANAEHHSVSSLVYFCKEPTTVVPAESDSDGIFVYNC